MNHCKCMHMQKKQGSSYLAIVGKFPQAWAILLGRVARFCALHPAGVISCWVLTMSLLMIGITQINTITATDELWVNPVGLAANHQKIVNALYPPSDSYLLAFVIEARKPVGDSYALVDMLTLDTMTQLWNFHDDVYALKTPTHNKSLSDLCVRSFGECIADGPFNFWANSRSLFQSTATSDATVKTIMAQPTYPNGQFVDRVLTLANFSANAQGQASALGVGIHFVLNQSYEADINEFVTLVQQLWLAQPNSRYFALTFAYFYQNSVDDGLSSLVVKDIKLLIIAFVVMIAFAQIFLGRPGSLLEGRMIVGVEAVAIIFLSMGGAFGLCMACNVPFTTLGQILPFLLLGIGIDNAFVLCSAVDRQSRSLDIETRMERALARVGPNLTVTSLVDVAALLLAELSSLPAVRYFGVYAGVSILFIFVSYITAFVSFVALDERRRASARVDVAPCVKLNVDAPYHLSTPELTAMTAVDDFLQNKYAPVLHRPIVRIIVIVCFGILTGVMLWAALQYEGYDFHVADLLPEDGAAFEYIAMHKQLFKGLETPDLNVQLYFANINYTSAAVQFSMRHLIDTASMLPIMSSEQAPTDWLAAMTAFGKSLSPYNKSTMDSTGSFFVGPAFYFVLQGFLNVPDNARQFGNLLAFDKNNQLSIAAVQFTLGFQITASEKVNALDTMRALVGSSPFPPDQVFFSSGNEELWEQLGFMKDEATRLFIVTLIVVGVVCALFLVHPGAIFIQLLAMGMIFIDILGALALTGVQINSISVVNLIMSIGLVVDATVHIVRTFGVQDPSQSRAARVTQTLGELGTPILLGAISLILGVAALSTASSAVFRTFFVCFMYIVLFGWLHGLVFVPVLLSLAGPVTFVNVSDPYFLQAPRGHVALKQDSKTQAPPNQPSAAAGSGPEISPA